MSYVNGKPFTQYRFNSKGKFYEAVARVLRALTYIHARGLVHCDLKPQNILIRRGNPKILDFGLATIPDESTKARGSIHYIAPELFRGARPDPRADLYSFGVVLYRALMHRLPFEGDSVSELMVSHVRSRPVRIHKRTVEPAFASMVMNLLEVDPGFRYRCAEAALEDLKTFLPRTDRITTDSGLGHIYTSSFVGREKELLKVELMLKECIKGLSQFVFVVGPEGVGKSRLASEVKRKAQVHGIRTQTVWCTGREPVRLVEDVPPKAPSLVTLEDAHRVDLRDAGELSRLLRSHSDKPVTFLLLCETGKSYQRLRERLSSFTHWNQIQLRHLSEDETLAMVEGMLLRMHEPQEIGRVVYDLSGGIPLLVEGAVRSLAQSGVLRKKLGRWRLSRNRRYSIDLSRKGIWTVGPQLEDLSESEKRTLEMASVAGVGMGEDIFSQISGADDEVRSPLMSLVSRGLMTRGPRGRFLIANGYLASHIRSLIPARRKKELHLKIAGALSPDMPDVAAGHFMLGGSREKAREMALNEAKNLERRRDSNGACSCYEIALRASRSAEEKLRILMRLTHLYDGQSNPRKALAAVKSALEIDDREEAGLDELRVKAASIHTKLEEYSQAENMLKDVLAGVEDERVKASALCELAWLRMQTNQSKEALEIAKDAQHIAERESDESGMAKVYHTLGTIRWNSGSLEASERLMKKAIKLKEKLGLHASAADSLNNLGVICWTRGDMGGAEKAYRKALQEFRKAGDKGGVGAILTNIGLVEWIRGEWESALKDYEKAYLIQEELGDRAALVRRPDHPGREPEALVR